jgi:rfaE bifunctional protein kinase chain/domain
VLPIRHSQLLLTGGHPAMTSRRVEEILEGLGRAAVAVLGDFFLDKYLEIDPALDERSLETGLTARQVVSIRCQPGGAGNVAANLSALGIGKVYCIGIIGDDGEGSELVRALRQLGADTEGLAATPDCVTPTYRKPVIRMPDGKPRELERLDSKNREPMPQGLEEALLRQLREAVGGVDAVIVQDQVQEPDCGVITTRVRRALAEFAEQHESVAWLADSRIRAGEFRNVVLKPNREEVCAAVHPGLPAHDLDSAIACAQTLSERTGASVFLTLGEHGMAVATREGVQRVPTVQLSGELDIVGAGDSAAAGIASALCAGASLAEAAVLGNIVASITVQQLGTTGNASQQQVMARFAEHQDIWRDIS